MTHMLIGCWLGRCSVYLPKIQMCDNYRSHGKTSHCNWPLVKITLLWIQCGTNQGFITKLIYSAYLKSRKRPNRWKLIVGIGQGFNRCCWTRCDCTTCIGFGGKTCLRFFSSNPLFWSSAVYWLVHAIILCMVQHVRLWHDLLAEATSNCWDSCWFSTGWGISFLSQGSLRMLLQRH